jgi:hypothetical protein
MLSHLQERKLLIGFMPQPFLSAILGAAFGSLASPIGISAPVWSGDPYRTAISFAVVTGLVGFVMCVVAWPWASRSSQRAPLSLGQILSAAIVLGNVPGACLWGLLLAERAAGMQVITQDVWPSVVRIVTVGSAFGAASGVLFWLICVRLLRINDVHNSP